MNEDNEVMTIIMAHSLLVKSSRNEKLYTETTILLYTHDTQLPYLSTIFKLSHTIVS